MNSPQEAPSPTPTSDESDRVQRASRLHELAVKLFSESQDRGKDSALRAATLIEESVKLHATAQSLLNLGKLYMVADLQLKAIECGKKCLEIPTSQQNIESNRMLGQAHAHLAQYEEALPHLRAYHLSVPTDAANEFDMAYTLLALGHYQEGWKHYLVRYRQGFSVSGAKDLPKLSIPEWDGRANSLLGKTILLVPEQGYGDEVHFARITRHLNELGAKVWVMVQPPLLALMRTLPWKERVVGTDWRNFEEADIWCTSLKASALLGLDPYKDLPCCPYLMCDPQIKLRFSSVVSDAIRVNLKSEEEHKLRPLVVGINWRGNAQHFNDAARSMSLEQMISEVRSRPETKHATLLSVQMNPSPSEIELMAQEGVANIAGHISNFADLAGALSCLNHFFTVDSAPAHLAGALSVNTTLLVPTRIDWRWGTPQSRPSWYPSMQIKIQDRAKINYI